MRIDLNRGAIVRDGFTFFPDSSDRNTWRVLPNHPTLRRQSTDSPTTILSRFRGPDGRQGGLLQMELEVSAPEKALVGALRGVLKGAGTVYVLPVAPLRVICDVLLGTDAGSGLSLLSTQADPTSPFSVSVRTELTPDGTSMMEAALQAGAPDPTVLYRFYVMALLPAIPVRVEVDWRRAAEFIATRFGRERVIAHWELDEAATQLVETGQIRLLSLDVTPEGAAQAIEQVTALVASELCDPAPGLPPSDAKADRQTSRVPSSLQYAGYTLKEHGAPGSVGQYDLAQQREATVLLTAVDTLASLLNRTLQASGPSISWPVHVVTDSL